MAISAVYIGPEYSYICPVTNEKIELIKEQSYLIDVRLEGPQVIANGRSLIILSDSTYWVIFDAGRVQIPYSPQLYLNTGKVSRYESNFGSSMQRL